MHLLDHLHRVERAFVHVGSHTSFVPSLIFCVHYATERCALRNVHEKYKHTCELLKELIIFYFFPHPG